MFRLITKMGSVLLLASIVNSVAMASDAYWEDLYQRSEVCSSADGQMGLMETAEEVVEKTALRTEFSSDCIQDRLTAMGYWVNTEYRRVRLGSHDEVDLICQVFTSHVVRCD